LLFTLCLSLFWGISHSQTQDSIGNLGSSVSFTENKGQISDQDYNPRPDVLFSGSAGGLDFYIREDGISYQMTRIDSWKEEDEGMPEDLPEELREERDSLPDEMTIYRTDINWIGARTNYEIEKGTPTDGFNNYYLPSCPDGALNVLSYQEVTFKNLYQGIDVKWYENAGTLEYDFIVSPNTDPSQIRWKIEGAEEISIGDHGELLVTTPLGKIEEQAPIAYQEGDEIEVAWLVEGNTIGFEIGAYNTAIALTIDPVVRVWGTYYGGTGSEHGYSCAADDNGNVFLAGLTYSTSGIATTGSHQSSFTNYDDAYLVKFNGSGVRQWGTYYSGNLGDAFHDVTIVDSNNIVAAGPTSSSSGITTTGAHQTSYGGGNDIMMVSFNHSGVRQWATYYGGSSYEGSSLSCTTDSIGNVYLSGPTASTAGIATTGAHQTSKSGDYDAFLVKFDSSGARQWGTYFGGTLNDLPSSCVTDKNDNIFLAGYTRSGSGIATSGSHDSSLNGSYNAFLVKFNSSGVRQWGTYYGGGYSYASDVGSACASDDSGNVFLAGRTKATSGISTGGAHQGYCASYYGSGFDGFLVKFNSSGVRQWGTYYGGTLNEDITSCAVDANGNVFLVGHTSSTSNISTTGAHQTTSGGSSDGYLVKFNSSGVRQWGTYYGSSVSDYITSCALGIGGNVFFAGDSQNSSGLASTGSHQASSAGSRDAFLVKFDYCGVDIYIDSVLHNLCFGDSAGQIILGDSGFSGVPSFQWTGTSLSNDSIFNLTAGTYIVTATDANGCSAITSVTITQPTQVAVSSTSTLMSCYDGSDGTATASATGGTGTKTFVWSTGSTSATTTGLTAGAYTVTATDANSCTSTTNVTITQPTQIVVSTTQSNVNTCFGGSNGTATASATGGTGTKTYLWSTGSTSATTTGLSAGTYTVTAIDANSCTSTTNVTITQPTQIVVSTTQSNVNTCFGGSNGTATASATGGTGTKTYLWSTGSTSATTTGLTAGAYTVTATDANSCTSTTNVTITQPTQVAVSSTSTVVSCYDGSDGTVTAAGTGGTGTKTFVWSTGSTSTTTTGLSAGTYSVTATDANGCTANTTANVTQRPLLEVSITDPTPVTCKGGSNSTATASSTGGTGSKSYLWSNAETTNSATTLSAGSQSVTVTDANGCTATESVEVVEPDSALTSSITQSKDNVCPGDSTASIEVIANGGWLLYDYLWSDSSQGTSISSLGDSTYWVRVTDSLGCETSDTFTVVRLYENPTVDLGPDSIICDRMVINIDAGNLGSTYLWSTGDSTQVINNYDLQPGITMAYMVLVTDVNGCKGSDTVYISVSHCLGMDEPIEGELQLYPNPTRDRVTLAYPGGYEYSIHDSKGKLLKEGRAHDTTTIEMQGLASGNYNITITTNAGQSLTRQVIVQ